MKELQVSFGSIREIEQFVRVATGIVGGIRVSEGSKVTNGKSILGLISMGLSKALTVIFDGTDTEYEAFLSGISEYIIPN